MSKTIREHWWCGHQPAGCAPNAQLVAFDFEFPWATLTFADGNHGRKDYYWWWGKKPKDHPDATYHAVEFEAKTSDPSHRWVTVLWKVGAAVQKKPAAVRKKPAGGPPPAEPPKKRKKPMAEQCTDDRSS